MSDNLSIYGKVRAVPAEAVKPITGGRLKGKSDINPVWRIKTLTEQFGPCGIGWKYEITDKQLERGGNDEIAAFVDINLYIKVENEWSAAIPGTGGSSFVAKESSGLYTSDECFKMALTDALSVACKALGVGADVYWDKDKSKYDTQEPKPEQKHDKPDDDGANIKATKDQINAVFAAARARKEDFPDFEIFQLIDDLAAAKKISSKYTYADKEKTKINWTQKDISVIMTELEMPF